MHTHPDCILCPTFSDATSDDVEANERTSLLPPSGISTNEQEAANEARKMNNRATAMMYNSPMNAASGERQYYGRRVSDPSDRQTIRRTSGSDLAFESNSKVSARDNKTNA